MNYYNLHRKRHFAFYGGDEVKIGGKDFESSNKYEHNLGDLFNNIENKKNDIKNIKGGKNEEIEPSSDDEFSNYIVVSLF